MLSPAQLEAFEQVKKLLGEHFDNYVIIVESEINDPDTQEIATFWRGSYQGHSCAVGLCEKYKAELIKDVARPDET